MRQFVFLRFRMGIFTGVSGGAYSHGAVKNCSVETGPAPRVTSTSTCCHVHGRNVGYHMLQ